MTGSAGCGLTSFLPCLGRRGGSWLGGSHPCRPWWLCRSWRCQRTDHWTSLPSSAASKTGGGAGEGQRGKEVTTSGLCRGGSSLTGCGPSTKKGWTVRCSCNDKSSSSATGEETVGLAADTVHRGEGKTFFISSMDTLTRSSAMLWEFIKPPIMAAEMQWFTVTMCRHLSP